MKKSFLITIISIIVLVACQRNDEPHEPHTATITFGSPNRSIGMEWEIGHTRTRDAGDIPVDMPDDIGVFAYYDKKGDQEVFDNQRVLYFYSEVYSGKPFKWDYWNGNSNNGISSWPYTITPDDSLQKQWKRQNYRFLAYSPWMSENVSVSSDNFDFNTLNWIGIPEYSDCDYMIAKNVVSVDNTKGSQNSDHPVPIELQHLMARIRVVFAMSEHYRQIRRIVINSVRVKSSGKKKSVTAIYRVDNSLSAVNWGDLIGAAPLYVNLQKEDDEDYDVKTSMAKASAFGSLYVMPQSGFNELTLTVNYSTYDSAGMKTRDAEISNKVTLSDPWDLSAGKYYDLKISIVPDYLYVLSDNDQDFDGWVIVDEQE